MMLSLAGVATSLPRPLYRRRRLHSRRLFSSRLHSGQLRRRHLDSRRPDSRLAGVFAIRVYLNGLGSATLAHLTAVRARRRRDKSVSLPTRRRKECLVKERP